MVLGWQEGSFCLEKSVRITKSLFAEEDRRGDGLVTRNCCAAPRYLEQGMR